MKILTKTLLTATVVLAGAIAGRVIAAGPGEGYDPVNPGDPNEQYRVTVSASPAINEVELSTELAKPGTTVTVRAVGKYGYVFDAWYEGDRRVSEDAIYSFEMPARGVNLTAYFNYDQYNPENPGDPMLDGYHHRVRVFMTPSNAGYINPSSSFLLKEGESIKLYAYPNNNFKFEGWVVDGKLMEPDADGNVVNPITITMGKENQDYTAKFSFSPQSPDDPMRNSFNETTGDMIVDNFTPDNLGGAIAELMSARRYNITKGDIHSLIVAGKMTNYDAYAFYDMTNCVTLDLGRTDGLTVPTYTMLTDMYALTDLVLPASLQEVDDYTFYNNRNLSRVVCYAQVPPAVSSEFFYNMPRDSEGYYDGVTLYVPATSMALYQQASGWKYFKLAPIDSEECSVTVNLPDDWESGRYRNMTLALENSATGVTQRYVVNNRPTYVFNNLIMSTTALKVKYNLTLSNAQGDILCEVKDIELTADEPTTEITLDNVASFYDLTLKVLQSDGKDVAGDLNITWRNINGDHLAAGATLPDIIEGKKVTATIALNDNYGKNYEIPAPVSITSGAESVETVINLVEFEKAVATGTVTDATTGLPIENAYVTVDQTLSGKYRTTATGVTDKDGKYSLEYVVSEKASGKVTCRATDYVTQPQTVESFADWSMTDFEMKGIDQRGVINVSLLWQAVGSDAEPQAYGDYANVDFTLYDKDADSEIANVSVQYPKIVLLDSVDPSHSILVTAKSRTKDFADVFDVVSLDESGKADLTLTLVERGKITANIAVSPEKSAGALLYGADGHLRRHTVFDEKGTAHFSRLNEGAYTLVAIMDSPYFNGVSSLADFERYGLVAGTEYLLQNVTVNDGKVTEVSYGEVPSFDESQFYFTDAASTYLAVNKSSVNAGNYVTVSTRFNFLDKYKGWTEYVRLVYELPEEVEFVENSVINGNEPTGAVFNQADRTLTIYDVTPGNTVKFCLMPTKGDSYYPTANVLFTYKGDEYEQPLGSVYFQATDYKILTPRRTSRNYVYARGTATSAGDVTVFVNGVPVAAARATGNGDWTAQVKFNEPITPLQQVYGEITDAVKGTFPTESTLVEYDEYFPELNKVTLLHGGSSVSFDHTRAKTSAKSYSYNPAYDLFTFTAKFDENAERVSAVTFRVLASDGSERTIEATYMPGTGLWTAALGYPDSFRIPVNATVEFTYTKPVPSEDAEGEETETEGVSTFNMDYIAPNVQPIIDPSGFVYEVEESNRLADVTVTVFHRVSSEDMAGEITWQSQLWDATEYGQENPLRTDSEGFYAWDVPTGTWQVKYEKSGYETAYSVWLPVPPPQLEVNMGMVRNSQPAVIDAHAYNSDNGVEITFDHYMKLASMDGNVYVMHDGSRIEGQVVVKTAEGVAQPKNATTVRFIPETEFTSDMTAVTLIVSAKVQSYAGIEMGQTFEQELTVEKEITDIAAQHETLEVIIGEPYKAVVSATPGDAAAGRTLRVENGSADILEIGTTEAELDENGQATIVLNGLMPGQTKLTFTIDGSNAKGTAVVKVVNEVLNLEAPVASIPDKAVPYYGTETVLTNPNESGTLYFTTDGSEPDAADEMLYTEPIVIDRDMTVKAIVIKGKNRSDIAEFNYKVRRANVNMSVDAGWTWVSHNVMEGVDLESRSADLAGLVNRVESLDKAADIDAAGNVSGTLMKLDANAGYKVKGIAAGSLNANGYAANPAEAISVQPGKNLIGYALDEVKGLDEAFAATVCEEGDVVVGRDGFAVFNGVLWLGDLFVLEPGNGYMYYSGTGNSIVYDNSRTSDAAAKYAVRSDDEAVWAVDKPQFASVMPMVVEIFDEDSAVLTAGQLGAFCGTECRGVARYVDGHFFLSVFGDGGDEITFRLLRSEDEDAVEINRTLTFAEQPEGTLDSPYVIDLALDGASKVTDDSNVKVECHNRVVYVYGDSVHEVAVYDVKGNKVAASTAPTVRVDTVAGGVYVVAVNNGGTWSYHKIAIR